MLCVPSLSPSIHHPTHLSTTNLRFSPLSIFVGRASIRSNTLGKKKETVSKISEKSVLEKKAIPIQNQKETVDNETKVNETKVNETKVNETKVNETKVNETKVNELPKSGTADNQKVKQMPDYKAMTKLELTVKS